MIPNMIPCETHFKKKDILTLRNKSFIAAPLEPINLEQSPFPSSINMNQETELTQPLWQDSKIKQQPLENNLFMLNRNKIYQKTIKSQTPLNENVRKGHLQRSLNKIKVDCVKLKKQGSQQRPKSSHPDKLFTSSEIFKANNDVLNYQNRPGSSKSSRFFRLKNLQINDRLNCENSQVDSLGRIAGSINQKPSTRPFTSGRLGGSLNHIKGVNNRVTMKLDSQFYGLFAQ